MHLVIGVALTVFAFFMSQYTSGAIEGTGLLNTGALVLLVLGPIGVTLVGHPFSQWRSNFRVLLRAFRYDRKRSLLVASEEMGQIARAVRESRWNEAEGAINGARSEQVKLLVPHLLAKLEPGPLKEAVASSAFRWMADVKAADEFLLGLARFSPAFGMIGTIMGLVDLFKNMRDSASLGPGMAMALLATLYGLILCYCVYMPLAQRVRAYLIAGAQEQRVIERAINLVSQGRPIHEVRSAVLDGGLTQSGAG